MLLCALLHVHDPGSTDCRIGLAVSVNAFCLQVDEELLRQQQEAYKVAGVDENEQINPRDKKKRKNSTASDEVSAPLFALIPPPTAQVADSSRLHRIMYQK